MEILFLTMATAGVLLVVLGLIGLHAQKLNRPRSASSRGYSTLVAACFDDKAKADHLIRYESSRAPSISRAVAIDRALARLVDDRERL